MSFALFIPRVGTQITLAEEWTFVLYPERRNGKFWLKAELPMLTNAKDYDYIYGAYVSQSARVAVRHEERTARIILVDMDTKHEFVPLVTLPKGSVLKVSRVYIRAGGQEFDAYSSLTFTLQKCPGKKLKGRFWAKLDDVNKMIIEDPERSN